MMISFLRIALILAVAAIGGFVALYFDVPAALLIGGLLATAVLSFSRIDMGLPAPLLGTAFLLMGMLLGSNISSDTLALIGQWPLSLGAILLVVPVMVVICAVVLNRFFGVDPLTSYLSSLPGHLSMVLAISAQSPAQEHRVVVIQSVRLLSIMLFLPLSAMALDLVPDTSQQPAREEMQWLVVAVLAIICAIAGFIFQFLRVPAAMVLGPMIVASAGKLFGFYTGVLPFSLEAIGLIVIGALIGGRMINVSWAGLKQDLVAGLVVTTIMVTLTLGAAYLLTLWMDMPFAQIWLGLTPGGLEAISALGLALGYDTAFIAAHQAWRVLLLGVGIPAGTVFFRQSKPPA